MAGSEREEQPAAREGHDHFLESVNVVVRGLWARLADVFRKVAGSLVGIVYELDVDDVRVAGGDVPFLAEFASRKVVTSAQYVEVRMPVR